MLRARQSVTAFLTATGTLALLFTPYILIESQHYLPADVKIYVAGFLFFLTLLLLARHYRKNRPPFETFIQFQSSFLKGHGHEKLLNAIELYQQPADERSSFHAPAIASNLKQADPEGALSDLKQYIQDRNESRSFKKMGIFAGGSLLVLITVMIVQFEGTQRALHFWENYQQPNPWSYVVAPGDTTLEHGSRFSPELILDTGEIPERILFSYKTDIEESYRTRPMHLTDEGNHRFRAPEIELTGSITYRIEMDQFHTESYRADVQMQPRFESLTATIHPPSYTRLSPQEREYPFSELAFYPGSEITVEGDLNKELEELSVRLSNSNTEFAELTENGRQVRFTFSPDQSDTLRFRMVDADGLNNRNPYTIRLNLREDQYPAVALLEPTGTIRDSSPDRLRLLYRATDDFGLTRAELRWELNRAFTEEPLRDRITLSNPSNGYSESYEWDLSALNLRPRDELTFHIRVWDNDEVSGYKYSNSNRVTLTVPSLAENFEELDSRERNIQGEFDDISENFRNMEREYEEFLERLRQNPEGGFEEEQMLEEVRERQEQIDESIQKMNEEFERLRNEIMQNDKVSEETRRAYRELQQLMKELDDPALREAMEELQRALQEMSPQEIERALENVDFNENLYRERLERTVELFKQLKMNSSLDRIAGQYEDLAERLEPADDQTMQELKQELRNVQDDLESLESQIDGLDENPPRRAEERIRELKEQASDQLREIRRSVGEMESAPDSRPGDDMQQDQQQISEQMRSEAERFRAAMQQMSGQQIQVNILALQRALYTLLELSDHQEYVTRLAGDTRSRSQGFVELARNQKNISDQFSVVADTIFQVSSEIPGVPNQINRKKAEVEQSLSRSMDSMVERNQRNASVTSRESFSGINDLTSMLASLIDQLMDQQNGGGSGMSMQQMIEQMQQMSGDQQMLNQQLQELINDMAGDRLSQEESERLDQLARQQNEIRRQLQELQRRGVLEQGDRTLSELQRMIDDMEDSINDLRGGMTDPIMVERQQNILSRMLDAEQALQQRGETEEREGTASDGYDRTLPPDMTLQELEQEIRSRLQDPNYTPFSESYRRLIERYFEQLRRFEQRSGQ